MEVIFKARVDLPAAMLRDIGRLIVRYAYVEQGLQGIIYTLLGVEAGVGRLAVREPGRLTDKFDLLLDLMAATNRHLPATLDPKALREIIEDTTDMRNLCAHSMWIWSAKQRAWAVVVTRGQWAGIPKTERARRSKRLFPEGQIVRPETLKIYIAGADEIEKHLRQLRTILVEQPKS